MQKKRLVGEEGWRSGRGVDRGWGGGVGVGIGMGVGGLVDVNEELKVLLKEHKGIVHYYE